MNLSVKSFVVVTTFLLLLGTALAGGDKPVKDLDLGLSKSSVFDTPDPIVAPAAGAEPGENAIVTPYGEGVPPIIPHDIEEFLPISIDRNDCLDCHVDAALVGQPVEMGDPTPAPASHFTDLRTAPETMTSQLIGARYFCNQCHVPQSATDPLVENSVH